MEAVKNILREELGNSKKLRSNYLKSFLELPKGSLVAKKMGKQLFYYLAYRDGPKVVFDYKGKMSPQDIQSFKKSKEQQKFVKKQIKKVDAQIRYLEKALRVKA